MEKQQALVIFSGGQDSTTCLIQAIQTYGRENVQAITFQYGQRHAIELERARWIAQDLGVKQTVLDLSLMQQITHNALMDDTVSIETASDGLFTFQILRQTTLAQNTARTFMTTTDHAVITGMRMLANIIQHTHFIRQCPSLRFG